MSVLFFILTIISIVLLLLVISRLGIKLNDVAPSFKQYDGLIIIAITFVFAFSYTLGISVCKSQTDTIKDYNKGLYQEKITYESIDGNIIPKDTVYIFKK
jgi:uncharacterized membrane protein